MVDEGTLYQVIF